MSADQKKFEDWALSHGGVSLKLAPEMQTITGRFPATYLVDETEIAWRAWANKHSAIAPPVVAGSVDTGSKHDICRESERLYRQSAKDAIERAEKAEADLESWVHSNRIDELQRKLAHKQAIIDRLMLEYCPGEMTVEQMEEWAGHQKRAE